MHDLHISTVRPAMSCCLQGDVTGSYLIKDFVFGPVDAFTQGLDPGILLLRSLELNLDVVDLWKTRSNTTFKPRSVRDRSLAFLQFANG